MMAKKSKSQTNTDSDVLVIDRNEVTRPSLYKVIMHNDNFSTMDFVVEVLCTIYKHPINKANDLTQLIHTSGRAVAGTYIKEIAESKVIQTHNLARKREFPLKCTLEKE